MKKLFLLLLLTSTIIMAGCAHTKTTGTITPGTFSVLSGKVAKYAYTREMKKPQLSGMNNRDALQYGYHEKWTTTFTVPKEIAFDATELKELCQSGFSLVNEDNGNTLKTIPYKDFKGGATFSVSDNYAGAGLGLTFSSAQKDFLTNHGRVILQANSGFLTTMQATTRYEGEGNEPSPRSNDERVSNYDAIGGSPINYKRYPYNTIFITSDLLLHVYHRLFDNSLKYYEEATARPMITQLSQSMFTKFTTLGANEKDPTLKNNYDFLAAYWSIPNAILIPNDEILNIISTNQSTPVDGEVSSDLSDTKIKELTTQRLETMIPKLSPAYKSIVSKTLAEILKADNANGENLLIQTFSPDFLKNFTGFDMLKFDFTQFKPRAHYTTDSLLKTYFMAMKRLMREKLYFVDGNIATAGLIMVNNIQNADLKNFNTYYTFIQKLIGEDDDVNIKDMQTFISNQKRTSDRAIIAGMTPTIQAKLGALRPQKIMSVSYTTPQVEQLTEQEAKNMTNGFIFFGEKFTIDSRLFDQFTAGSAEKESEYKPRVQSALMAADNILNLPVTTKFAKLRLQENKKEFKITDGQIQGYDQIKSDVMKNPELTGFNFTKSTYHQWLDMLSRLFVPNGAKLPYFMQDALYQNKLLNTYLGSYTELKHDTLLYVKQAYAEMGGGGSDSCQRAVEPPALPVPKGYVEPNIELIDTLTTLTTDTNVFFNDSKYTDFVTFLNFVKKIAGAQTQNQKISDQDFETLRLYTNGDIEGNPIQGNLVNITAPQKLFGEPLQKEARGSIIADIFTSGMYGPLYEAIGRPYLMAVMVNDVNGARIVLGPIFSHYEFYTSQAPFKAVGGGRYTDQDWQNSYDGLKNKSTLLSLPLQEIMNGVK